MAAVTTELKIKVTKVGEAQLTKLSASLNQVAKRADAAKIDFKSLADELKKVQTTTGPKTVNDLRNYRNAWRDIADSVDVASKEFKQATAEAAKLDKQLQKTTSRRGGRLRAGAQVAGTVAGAGVFGGPEGAIGAGLGAILGGGVPGAIAGGAIGAQVGGLRQVAGGTADYAAQLEKLRIALFGVTTSQAEYQQSLQFIAQTSKDFAIPQDILTRQFTKLQASVLGAGGSIEDTKVAFNGIVAAVRATGGSLTDVDAALTATAQVFSKGKVSAEELRQQIGERLPGAFTLFAEAIGMTPQELDKALEKGQVSLQDFQVFAEAIFARYGENAKTIADAPASAGDRLKRDLADLQGSVGTLVAPIGAAFQKLASVSVRALTAITDKLDVFMKKIDGFAKLAAGLGQQAATAIFGPIGGLLANIGIQRFFPRGDGGAVDPRTGIEQPTAGAGLPGITPEAPKEAKTRAAREIVDITQQELEYRRAIVMARRLSDEFAEVTLRTELKGLQILQAKIGEREKAARLLELEQDETESLTRIIENQIKAIDKQEAAQFKAGQQIADALNAADRSTKKVKEELTDIQKITQEIGAQLGSTLMSAFDNLINKTQKWSDFLRNALMQVGKLLMTAGLNLAAGPAGGGSFLNLLGFGTRANGGPVAGGRPYLVGEQGPELFMPRAGGAVTSNRELRQAMNQPASSMNFTFETTNIGGTEYVSREQLEAAMATTRRQAANDGAKRGMNMTLDRMQNSPRTRARVGIA